MKNFLTKLTVGLASAAILSTGVATSVFADTTISGNGAGSINSVTLSNKCKSSVYQSNNTSVSTHATVIAETGGNTASSNTGGDVTVASGDATAGVSITVDGGSNEATAPDCCACVAGPNDVTVKENGAGTVNVVSETKKQKTKLSQKNKTKVSTHVTVKGKTGKNTASSNTGPGVVEVTSGNAEAGLEVSVTAPSNTTL